MGAAAGCVEPPRHPAREEIELAAVLHALSDPVRLRIVVALATGGERSCKSFDLPVVKSTCTHHFRVLREAGVVRQRLASTTKLNSLRRQDLDARFPGLVDAVLGGTSAGPQRVRTAALPGGMPSR
ncbi:MAG: ArsR family transcriptional regulator [Actinomycetota bacterium]|nr:ArsR family transcriptional regulator [Actinomycetota bacterium]